MSYVKPPLLDEILRLPFAVTPNASVVEVWWPPSDVQVATIQAHVAVAAVSSGGTYLLSVSNSAGKNLLRATSFDLESLQSGKVTDIPLTLVVADLGIKRDQKVTFTVASNNADLTGSGLIIQTSYRRR